MFFFLAVAGLGGIPSGWSKDLRLGTVTEFPAEDLPKFQALADYLQKKLQASGVEWVKIVLPESIRAMGHLIQHGKMDLLFASPMVTAAIDQIGEINYLLRQWKDGVPEYHSVLFVKKDGPIQKISDLQGFAVAMESPYSSMGYLVPRYFLGKAGLNFIRIYRAGEKPPPDKTGYAFTFSDPLALEWVRRGLIKSGAVNNLIYEKNEKKNPDLKAIYQSPSFYRQVVAYRQDMDPELLKKVKAILLTMDQDPEGREILQDFYQTTKFDEIPEGPEDYEKSLEVYGPFLKKELNL
jgi:phosphonate transport system substrate-binding protein